MRTIQLPQFENKDKDKQTFDYLDWIMTTYNLDGNVLDLGTGHGKFAIRCRDHGMNVTAIDGRPDRIPFHEKGINWKVGDVNDFDVSGYDVVLFLGLLYHLTYEQQVGLLSRMDCEHLIINTHYAAIEDGQILNRYQSNRLTRVPGGLNYRECHNLEELKTRPLAALNNTTAFWPTLQTLERMLNDAGYEVAMLTPNIYEFRTFFVCTKSN